MHGQSLTWVILEHILALATLLILARRVIALRGHPLLLAVMHKPEVAAVVYLRRAELRHKVMVHLDQMDLPKCQVAPIPLRVEPALADNQRTAARSLLNHEQLANLQLAYLSSRRSPTKDCLDSHNSPFWQMEEIVSLAVVEWETSSLPNSDTSEGSEFFGFL